MTALKFVGQRRRPFTVDGPVTAQRYYVEPELGQAVEMDAADAEAILERDNELDLWVRATPTLEAVIEAAEEIPVIVVPDEPKPQRKGK